MKRNTKVYKPERGEQEPFSRQLARERKENTRLRDECKAQIDAVERKAGEKIDAACAERNVAFKDRIEIIRDLADYQKLHRDFARVAPVLRSRSILRRLWWGLRFGLWGVFGYEVLPGQDDAEVLKDRLHTIFRSAEAAGIALGDDPDYDVCKSFERKNKEFAQAFGGKE